MARFEGAKPELKQVFQFQLPAGGTAYFLPDRASAKESFPKSPLRFSNITSRFGPGGRPGVLPDPTFTSSCTGGSHALTCTNRLPKAPKMH